MVAPRKKTVVQKTEFDEEFDQIRKIELDYEKGQKLAEIKEMIDEFDEEIKEM